MGILLIFGIGSRALKAYQEHQQHMAAKELRQHLRREEEERQRRYQQWQ
jgi:hypothetical protein